MEAPTTVGALMELVHGANCMRTAITRFSELIEPLQNLLEAQYSFYNSRKKSRVCNRPLSAWEDEHQAVFHIPRSGDHPASEFGYTGPLENACASSQTHHPYIGLAC